MSSIIYKVVKAVRNEGFRRFMLKRLFRRNNLRLNYFKSYGDRFYVYGINDRYIPAETLNWYINYQTLADRCDDISFFKYKPKEGDIVVDIGAGLGEETVVMSDLAGKTGKVYSVEANPTVFKILKHVVELNNLTNVELLNLAISAEDGTVEIVDTDESYMTGFVGNSGNSTVPVEGLRFDSFAKRFGIDRIDLLKSNIEGAERFLVDSISKEYLPRIRNVAIACHDFRYEETKNDFFVTKEYIKKFLLDNSFEVETRNTGRDFADDWVYGRNLLPG
jgi:FkbM family methyltransferase